MAAFNSARSSRGFMAILPLIDATGPLILETNRIKPITANIAVTSVQNMMPESLRNFRGKSNGNGFLAKWRIGKGTSTKGGWANEYFSVADSTERLAEVSVWR